MFGGCLPMLITMPLFFIFIAAFRQWGNEMMVRLILTLDDNKDKGIELFQTFKFSGSITSGCRTTASLR